MGPELEELVAEFRSVERRLRDVLLGDALYTSGAVKGEDPRRMVSSQLRHLRSTFDAVAEMAADASGASLADDLRTRAERTTRGNQ